MRAAVATVILLAAGTASADRIPVLSVGGAMDLHFHGTTWDYAANKDENPTAFVDTRLTLAFEDPIPTLPRGAIGAQARLVPELLLGAELGSDRGEAYVGAGVRGEIALISWKMRTSMYAAARGFVIGSPRDAASEFALGQYIMLRGATRFGWEGAAVIRPNDRDGTHELDAVARLYVGWQI